MNETDTITIVIGEDSYDIGTIEKPYGPDDLGLFLIEAGVLLRHTPYQIDLAEVED